MINTKKLLISCLVILAIGSLTACTSEKANQETEITETTTNEVSENQEINETNTTVNEISDNQETNETVEYQPEFITVNYNNEGIYQYRVVRCNQDKTQELIECGKAFKENTNVTVTFANGNEFNGFEHKYGQNGECCYIRIVNGDEIETYDILEIKVLESLEEEYKPKYPERHFEVRNIDMQTTSDFTVIRCTEKETEYIEKTKIEDYDKLLITNEDLSHFQGMLSNYGNVGEKTYIKVFSGNDEYYFKVISIDPIQ